MDMELDELKKTWHRLDEQLKEKPLAGEEQIARIVEQCKGQARHSLSCINGFQRWSLWGAGAVMLVALIAAFIHLPEVPAERLDKYYVLLAFIALSFIAALVWDFFSYRLVRDIKVDQMPVAEVARRMELFHRRTNREVVGISGWLLLCTGVQYWYYELYLWPATTQLTYVGLILLFDALLVYLLYKHLIYKPMHNAEKNIRRINKL